MAEEATDVDALHADVPSHELHRLQLGPQPSRVADRDELAERPQPADRALEELAADRVDDHVDAQVVGEVVVDIRLVGAEVEAGRELLLRAGCGDDPRPERARDLDRRGADAARRGVHEHHRAVPQPHLPGQRHVGGEEGQEEGGALGEARVVGQRHERAAVDGGDLGVAAARDERHHARPVLQLAGDLRRRARPAAPASAGSGRAGSGCRGS